MKKSSRKAPRGLLTVESLQPYTRGCMRNNLLRKARARRDARRATLRAILKEQGFGLFLRAGWKKELATLFGVGQRTVYRDLRAIIPIRARLDRIE